MKRYKHDRKAAPRECAGAPGGENVDCRGIPGKRAPREQPLMCQDETASLGAGERALVGEVLLTNDQVNGQ